MVILGVVAASAVAAYVIRRHQIAQRYATLRSQGMAASLAGDDAKVIDLLSRYLPNNSGDADALRAYAQSRLKIHEPHHAEVVEAIAAYRQLVALQPDSNDDLRELLKLYSQAGYLVEARDTAGRLLDHGVNEPEVFMAYCNAAYGLRDYDSAKKKADQWVALKPNSTYAQIAEISILYQSKGSATPGLRQADQLLAQNPNDPRFELIDAYANRLAGRPEDAKPLLASAATQPSDDVEYIRNEMSELSFWGETDASLEDASLALLSRSIAAGMKEFTGDLGLRQWERDQFADAVATLRTLDLKNPDNSSELLGIYLSALAALGRDAEGADVQAILQSRQSYDPLAVAWIDLLPWYRPATRGQLSPAAVKAIDDALAEYPSNAFMLYFSGEAQVIANEPDLAITAFARSAKADLTWASPVVRIAQISDARHDLATATAAAEDARNRNDSSIAIEEQVAGLWEAGIEQGQTAHLDDLPALLDKIEGQAPGDPNALAIRVAFLCQTKNNDAVAAIKAAINSSAVLPVQTLLSLANSSSKSKLNLEDQIYARADQLWPNNVDIAYSEAYAQLLKGNSAAGKSLLDHSAKASGHADDVQWKFAWATYLEASQDPLAAAEWKDLASEYPQNPQIQTTALYARSVQSDGAFIDQTIERVHQLAGDHGIAWQLAQGRRLLAQNDPASVAKAVELLKQCVTRAPNDRDSHVFLGLAYERQDNINLAIEQFTAAGKLDANASDIPIELARLYQRSPDLPRSQEQLAKVAALDNLTAQQRQQIADIYGQEGQYQSAIDVLEKAPETNVPSLRRANFYLGLGNNDKVKSILTELLKRPDFDSVAFAMNFYASIGQTDNAQKAFAMLDGLKADPGVKELATSKYYALNNEPEKAIQFARQAVALAPKNVDAWKSLLAYSIAAGRAAELPSIMDGALAANPSDPVLNAASRNRDLLIFAAGDPITRQIGVAPLAQDPSNTDAAYAVLAVLTDKSFNANEKLTKLQSLSNRYDRFLPLQILLTQRYLDVGRIADAVATATLAQQVFPQDSNARKIAIVALSQAGNWSQVLALTDKFIPPPADAQFYDDADKKAHLEIAQSSVAASELSNKDLSDINANPDRYAALITEYAGDLIQAKLPGKAIDLIQPLLKRGSRWRLVWMSLAEDKETPSTTRPSDLLEQVTPLIDASNSDEEASLAKSWRVIGERDNSPAELNKSKQIVQALRLRSDLTPYAHFVLGMLAEGDHDLATAESDYRAAIAADSNSYLAENNLAMILINRGANLDDAASLIQHAIKVNPRMPDLHDTLALIDAKSKKFDDAIDEMTIASQLDRGSVIRRVRLGNMLLDAGRAAEARQILDQIRSMPTGSALADPDRTDLETFSQRLTNAG
jgi:predicted Zn-dependent protease